MSETATETDPTTGLPFDDVRVRNIHHNVDAPLIDSGSDEENIKAATKLTGVGKEPKPYEWSGTALPESGPSESAHAQMRRAARMQGNVRRDTFMDHFQKATGVDADTAHEITELVARDPAMPVRPTRDDGTQIPPLHDSQPVTEESSFKNLNEARRSMQNFRDVQSAEQQQLLWELGQRQEQQAAARRSKLQNPPYAPNHLGRRHSRKGKPTPLPRGRPPPRGHTRPPLLLRK